jgi:hypothetical protein
MVQYCSGPLKRDRFNTGVRGVIYWADEGGVTRRGRVSEFGGKEKEDTKEGQRYNGEGLSTTTRRLVQYLPLAASIEKEKRKRDENVVALRRRACRKEDWDTTVQ